MAFGGILKKAFTRVVLTKREYDPEIMRIEDFYVPGIFKEIEIERIIRDVRTELMTYKSLAYRLSSNKNIDVKEYNSYDIGILLNALKNNVDIKITPLKDYIPEFIYNSTENTIIKQISDIIKSYNENVNKILPEEMLRDQMIWTPKDMGYLLYYISIYKDIPKEK